MAQLFGLGFDDARDHALLDHGVALGADAGTEKEVGNVAPAHLLAVDPVAGITLTGEHALDGDFAVLAPGTGGTAFAVVEHQLDRRAAGRLAGGGTVEDHVLHRLAAQLFGGRFAQHPAHGVDHVGLAAAVGSAHGDQLPGHGNGGGTDKGLEASELDMGQTHGCRDIRSAGKRRILPGLPAGRTAFAAGMACRGPVSHAIIGAWILSAFRTIS